MAKLVNSLLLGAFKEEASIGYITVEFGSEPIKRDQGDFARTLGFPKNKVQSGNKQVD